MPVRVKSKIHKKLFLLRIVVEKARPRGPPPHKDYFEGVVQLRGLREEHYDYVHRFVERDGTWVTKEKEQPLGVDLWMSSQKTIQKLANALRDHFGCEIEISRKIFTRDRQTQKDVYRLNLLAEFPPFVKGEAIIVGDVPLYVNAIARRVSCTRLDNGKRTSVLSKQVKDAPLVTHECTVAKVMPGIEILDPETFQPAKAHNPFAFSIVPGQKVRAVLHNQWYVIGA